jgi:hypothetical protein
MKRRRETPPTVSHSQTSETAPTTPPLNWSQDLSPDLRAESLPDSEEGVQTKRPRLLRENARTREDATFEARVIFQQLFQKLLRESKRNGENWDENVIQAITDFCDNSPLDPLVLSGLDFSEAHSILPICRLLEANSPHFSSLVLKDCSISSASMLALAESLKKNTMLLTIDLTGTHLSNVGIATLLGALKAQPENSLHSLILVNTDITDELMNLVKAFLMDNRTLAELRLENNSISEKFLDQIQEIIIHNITGEPKHVDVESPSSEESIEPPVPPAYSGRSSSRDTPPFNIYSSDESPSSSPTRIKPAPLFSSYDPSSYRSRVQPALSREKTLLSSAAYAEKKHSSDEQSPNLWTGRTRSSSKKEEDEKGTGSPSFGRQ